MSWDNQLLLSIIIIIIVIIIFIITGYFPAPVCDYRVITGYNLGGFADEWGIGTTQMTWVIGWRDDSTSPNSKIRANHCQPFVLSSGFHPVARKRTFQADVSSSSPETSAETHWLI